MKKDEIMRRSTLFMNKVHECEMLKAALAERDAKMEEINEEAGKARLVMLLNHGHEGAYLDDGEMQCGQCGFGDYDFNKPSLSELTKRIVFMLNDKIADLKATVKRTDDLILTLTDDNEKQAEGIAGLDAELAELRAHHDEELTTAYDQIKEMTAENTTLKAEVARFIMQDGMCQTNTETGDPDLHRALNGG
jgi:hypothetical protein